MPALGEPYISLEEMKDYLYSGSDQKTQTDRHNTKITNAIKSVCREINLITDRQFNRAEEVSERAYGPENLRWYKDSRRVARYYLEVDDFYTTDGLVIEIDGTIVTDYVLKPRGGRVAGEEGEQHYDRIEHNNITAHSEINVTAKWGWASVPDDIIEGLKIAVEQNYSLTRGMNGIAGVSPLGHGIKLRDNEMAMAKIKRYRRHVVFFKGAGGG